MSTASVATLALSHPPNFARRNRRNRWIQPTFVTTYSFTGLSKCGQQSNKVHLHAASVHDEKSCRECQLHFLPIPALGYTPHVLDVLFRCCLSVPTSICVCARGGWLPVKEILLNQHTSNKEFPRRLADSRGAFSEKSACLPGNLLLFFRAKGSQASK